MLFFFLLHVIAITIIIITINVSTHKKNYNFLMSYRDLTFLATRLASNFAFQRPAWCIYVFIWFMTNNITNYDTKNNSLKVPLYENKQLTKNHLIKYNMRFSSDPAKIKFKWNRNNIVAYLRNGVPISVIVG